MGENQHETKTGDASDRLMKCRMEALKLIQEWSKGLIGIQTGAVAAVGFWLQREAGDFSHVAAVIALGFLIVSLFCSTCFLWTTIPTAIAQLPRKSDSAHDDNVYNYTGGGTWPISRMMDWQAGLFMCSVVCFTIAAVFATHEKQPTVIDGRLEVQQVGGR